MKFEEVLRYGEKSTKSKKFFIKSYTLKIELQFFLKVKQRSFHSIYNFIICEGKNLQKIAWLLIFSKWAHTVDYNFQPIVILNLESMCVFVVTFHNWVIGTLSRPWDWRLRRVTILYGSHSIPSMFCIFIINLGKIIL